jgi:uncharacterized LabA/DUF88 family protein
LAESAKARGEFAQTGQQLVMTKYFTARISSADPGKQRRQVNYLEALSTLKNFQIYYGHYLSKPVTCFKCKNRWNNYEEKMTDVNIATELLMDAVADKFDVALIISGDSDLVPPLRVLRKDYPHKRTVVAFPPNRESAQLKNFVNGYFMIGEAKFRNSQFPDRVTKPDGFVLNRPMEWTANIREPGLKA